MTTNGNGSNKLTFAEQLERHWIIIASVLSIGIAMQIQIAQNTTSIDSINEWRKQAEPLYLKNLEVLSEVRSEVRALHVIQKHNSVSLDRLYNKIEKNQK